MTDGILSHGPRAEPCSQWNRRCPGRSVRTGGPWRPGPGPRTRVQSWAGTFLPAPTPPAAAEGRASDPPVAGSQEPTCEQKQTGARPPQPPAQALAATGLRRLWKPQGSRGGGAVGVSPTSALLSEEEPPRSRRPREATWGRRPVHCGSWTNGPPGQGRGSPAGPGQRRSAGGRRTGAG